MRVLVVEDEPKLAGLLARGLGEEGHPTDVVASGREAVWMARATPYDAIVLDVMLPGQDGFAVCRELRAANVWTPVLFLTARDSVDDRVEGLDVGGDDYLVKPFSFPELLARPRASISWSAGGTWRTRHARTSWTSTCATSARRSTGRSGAIRSRRFAASATGCAHQGRAEADPHPLAPRRRLRRLDGGAPPRARGVRVPPGGGRAPELGRPGPPGAVGGVDRATGGGRDPRLRRARVGHDRADRRPGRARR